MVIQFQKGAGANQCTYPMTQEQLDNLAACRLVNPVVGKHHGVKPPDDFDIVASTWEILRVRQEVEKGEFPHWFMRKYYPFKDIWGEFPDERPEPLRAQGLSFDNPKALANIVHMDDPMDLILAIKKWLVDPMYGQSVNVNKHTNDYINFLETVPNINEDITDCQKRSVKRIWEIKYYYGIARPEEQYELMTGNKGALMTAYCEGSPNHPSAGQGHMALAAGGGSSILRNFKYDLMHEQIKVILDCVYMWGQFRCLAGVHHAMDGIMSLVAEPYMRQYLKDEIVEAYTI